MLTKELLDELALKKNTKEALFEHADPLQVASKYKDEYISLLCALFAYGNARLILRFLSSLDYELLNLKEDTIKKELKGFKYRFQSERDVAEIFISLRRLKQLDSLENLLSKAYKQGGLLFAIKSLIDKIYEINSYRSFGYEFFFAKSFEKEPKSPLKRYNMFLRWMVRKDELDLGLFTSIDKKDLLIPLDTHTHKVALAFKLMQRKNYDFKAVLELSAKLREFDFMDPVKYDFALYRLGQSKEYKILLKS